MEKLFNLLCNLSYSAIVLLGIIFGLVFFNMGYYVVGLFVEIACVLTFLYPVKIASKLDLKDLQIKTLEVQLEGLNNVIDRYKVLIRKSDEI